LNTGWFSDRSACYLAAGRPVITQETGFTRLFGGRRGLFAFRTIDEIAEAVREINADYATHSRAAYEIAVEHFEATKVVGALLERAGI
jgi:glycosyltransferase involved in cell wall biosynthesis